jgi:DNA-binding SARP family transcriptional activator
MLTTAGRPPNARADSLGGRSRRAAEAHPSLALLGGFELTVDGAPVPLPTSAQRVLAFLALQERRVQRAYVAGTLWEGSTDTRAAGCLRSAVWRLRRTGLTLLEGSGQCLGIAQEVGLDLRDAAAWAHRLLDPAEDVCPTVATVGLSKDLLPDWYDDWVTVERERFRELRVHALEQLSDRLVAAGRFAEAIEAALEAVRGEPLRESAHRALIRVHLSERNVARALDQYHECRRLLKEQLGLGPSREMSALMSAVLRS